MRALVVDDSRTMRSILSRSLAVLGAEVEEAEDGAVALSRLQAGALPDLALVDWNMPVMDGLTFVREARRRPEWRSLTIMMVTTEGEYDQIARAMAAGAHEYLVKPFTAEALFDKLELLGLAGSADGSNDAGANLAGGEESGGGR